MLLFAFRRLKTVVAFLHPRVPVVTIRSVVWQQKEISMSNQNQKNPDQQADVKDEVKKDEIRLAEIRKAVHQDEIDPNHMEGNQNTGYSGGG